MTDWVWLSFVILTNLISVTLGQLPITPTGTLSQREIIKNQMRNVFQGRSGYIPILSYLRVRGGSISSASPAKPIQRVSTSRPVAPVNGRTIDSQIQTRNGLNWIYMVPNNNRQLRPNDGGVLDERRRLYIPVTNKVVSSTTNYSLNVSPVATRTQNVKQNSTHINTKTTQMREPVILVQAKPNQVTDVFSAQPISNINPAPGGISSSGAILSSLPNGGVANRSAISSSYGKVINDSTVEITNSRIKSQLQGNASANSPSVTLGNMAHVQGQGSPSSVLVQEVEETGGSIGLQGQSTIVDDRTGGGNVMLREDDSLVLAPPGDDVRLLRNGEGYNNNGTVTVDDVQTQNIQQISLSNRNSLLSSQVTLDEANDLNQSNTNKSKISLDDGQINTQLRLNNVLTVLPNTHLNISEPNNTRVALNASPNATKAKPSFKTSNSLSHAGTLSNMNVYNNTKVKLSPPMEINKAKPSFIASNPVFPVGTPSYTNVSDSTKVKLSPPMEIIKAKSKFIARNTLSSVGSPSATHITDSTNINLNIPMNTNEANRNSLTSDTLGLISTSSSNSTNFLKVDNSSGVKSTYGGRGVVGGGIYYLMGNGTSPNVVGNVQSDSLANVINTNLNGKPAQNDIVLNDTADLIATVRPVHVTTVSHAGNINEETPGNTMQNPRNLIEQKTPIGNMKIKDRTISETFRHDLINTNNLVQTDRTKPIHITPIAIRVALDNVLPNRLESTVKTAIEVEVNNVAPKNRVMKATTTMVPNMSLMQLQSRAYAVPKRPIQLQANKQKLHRFLSRPLKPYPWTKRRPQLTGTVKTPNTQGISPHVISETATQSLFTERFVEQQVPISQATPVISQIYPTTRTPNMFSYIPVAENPTPKVNDQPLHRLGTQRKMWPKARPNFPWIVQATPPSDALGASVKKQQTSLPLIVQATPLSFNTVTPESAVRTKQTFQARLPIPFKLDPLRIGVISNKLSTLVNGNITLQGSGNQGNSKVQNSIVDSVRSPPLLGQQTNASSLIHPSNVDNKLIQLQYSNVSNDVKTNTAVGPKTVKTSLNDGRSGAKVSGFNNTAKGNLGAGVNPLQINTEKTANSVLVSNTGNMYKSSGAIMNTQPIKKEIVGTVPELSTNRNSTNRTRIVDLRVDPMRMHKYRYLFYPATFTHGPGNSIKPQLSISRAAPSSIPSDQSNRAAKNPTRPLITVSFRKTANLPILQAGPITSTHVNAPGIPVTAIPRVSPESVIGSPGNNQNKYLSFSVRPPSVEVRPEKGLNNSIDLTALASKSTNNSGTEMKTQTNLAKSINPGTNETTSFQDKGPPIDVSVPHRTVDANNVSFEPMLESIYPGTPPNQTTEELFFNSTFLVEALDLFNLSNDTNNLTIGLSAVNFNDTMMNDTFNDTMTNDTFVDNITTTSLPTTTPFGSMNALCGAHLVGHPDMPPAPTTTTADYYDTQAPSLYRFPWHNPMHPEYEPPEPSEAPEYEIIPGQSPAAPPTPPIGQCICAEKPECEGLGAIQGLPYEYMCDISAGLSCCCEPS